MLIKKTLLAAAAVMSLAVPAAAMAQDYGGYHDGGRNSQRDEGQRYEQRQDKWRAPIEHRRYVQPERGFSRGHDREQGYRAY